MTQASRGTLAVVLALAAAVVGAILVIGSMEPSPETLVMDRFERTVAEGWGESPLGGDYVVSGTRADYSVMRSKGLIIVQAAGITRSARLRYVVARDVDLSFRVSMDTSPTAGGSFAYGIVRHTDPQHEFRAKVRFAPGGGLFVGVTALVGTGERELSPEVRLPDLTYVPGTSIEVRARVEGDPATIRVKVWPANQTEPTAWAMRANAPAGLLAAPGNVGVQVYVSQESTALPVAFSFNRVEARELTMPGDSERSGHPASGSIGVPSPSP